MQLKIIWKFIQGSNLILKRIYVNLGKKEKLLEFTLEMNYEFLKYANNIDNKTISKEQPLTHLLTKN